MPDVIVSETMNMALGKEAQVATPRTLYAQAPAAALLPASLSVHLGLDRRAPDAPARRAGAGAPIADAHPRAWRHRLG
ncbi:hypothetical protein IGS59_01795 [Janthinobacterium sp. GW460P]|uniref:hypothetical protein n=1 Tax=unclassified Janthinobacterium TaxID=2610881 RepID=UPI00111C09FF|nr:MULTISPECIES: hypothetical protein [unclassified Janthinobacterium]MCC7700956.1 hypothetical protein [Janthinobacterium sp. GW460P]MCC7706463.1 hypothetical protein [Janthinobacterium sp. GW460W]